MSVEAFLRDHGWADAVQSPIAQDGSARRYLRLRRGPDTAVLMIAPPEDVQAFRKFLTIAEWLRAQGVAAPQVYAACEAGGLMLLEDFGTGMMAALANADPKLEPKLYAETGRVLSHLATCTPPDCLGRLDAERLVDQTGLMFDEMPNAPAPSTVKDWQGDLRRVLKGTLPGSDVLALRDLHAENIMWLPERIGMRRIGLLDFQDAVIAPPGYDLASLVDDPRRAVPDAIRDGLIASHGVAAEQIDLLSLARNLRILGIFRRVARLRNNPSYLAFLPRTAWLIRRAARSPAAASIRPQIEWVLAQYGLPEVAP